MLGARGTLEKDLSPEVCERAADHEVGSHYSHLLHKVYATQLSF